MNSHQNLIRIPPASEFLSKIASRFETAIEEVAKELVVYIEAKPEYRKELIELSHNKELINRLELIGRGALHAKLAFNPFPDVLKLAHCPLSEQIEILENGIEVLEPDGQDSRRILINALSKDQRALALGPNGPRDLAQQKTLFITRKEREMKSALKNWRVSRKDKKVFGPYKIVLPLRQLEQWVAELK